jgi:cupin 2 domain-containing protein
MEIRNICQMEGHDLKHEFFEMLLCNENIRLERIISPGMKNKQADWYDQDADEWVMLIQGDSVIEFEAEKTIKMKAGDYLLIPAHVRHRVVETSADPCCIWLAIHLKRA